MKYRIKRIVRKIPLAKSLARVVSGSRREDYLSRVGSPCHNGIVLYHDGVAIPPLKMRHMVRKHAILAEDFIVEGRQAFDAIKTILLANGVQVNEDARICEFGVGCGRIARHFISEHYTNFTGYDIDPELINWCEGILGRQGNGETHIRFLVNGYSPPLKSSEKSFDLIYSISVITHMTHEAQLLWFNELARVTAGCGLLLISFLERTPDEVPNGIEVVERIDREFRRTWLGKGGAPETYFTTHHTLPFLVSALDAEFEFVGYSAKAIRNTQSLALFRKRSKRETAGGVESAS